MQRWRLKNAEGQRAYNKKYYQANRERLKVRRAERWRALHPIPVPTETPEEREERQRQRARESARAWRAANRDSVRASAQRWRQKNPESVRRSARETAKRCREKRRAYWHNYQARINAAPGRGVAPAEWLEVRAASLGLCAYCNGRPARLEMDHIEPLAGGGAHDIDNIAAVCRSCNSSKSDTPLLVWLALRAARRQGPTLDKRGQLA